jgi:6-phosphogluconolactonase
MALIATVADPDALADFTAARLTSLVERSIAINGIVMLSLTGGKSPQPVYERLADPRREWRIRIDWRHLHFFWSDERHVAPDHPDSNFGMTSRALLHHVPISVEQVHRMRGELPDAGEAAREYEIELRDTFTRVGRSALTFDVALLGIGEDAHIASIFPESPLLATNDGDQRQRVAAIWAPHLNAWRITLTPPAILDARTTVVIASGERKAQAVHAALEASEDVQRWPAQLLRQAGDRVEWIIDRGASSKLKVKSSR